MTNLISVDFKDSIARITKNQTIHYKQHTITIKDSFNSEMRLQKHKLFTHSKFANQLARFMTGHQAIKIGFIHRYDCSDMVVSQNVVPGTLHDF